jgi:hypothetical protein
MKRFNHLFLCPGCNEMAVKADQEIEQSINRARELAKNWLETHIIKGGLMAGGAGHGVRASAAGGLSLPSASVSELRDQEATRRTRPPDPHR